jgi:hypothetical protein
MNSILLLGLNEVLLFVHYNVQKLFENESHHNIHASEKYKKTI